MNIGEVIHVDPYAAEAAQRDGDVTTTFWNGWTFNDSAWDRVSKRMIAEAGERARLRDLRPARVPTDDEFDDERARTERDWFVRD